jgi:hypothetical protein
MHRPSHVTSALPESALQHSLCVFGEQSWWQSLPDKENDQQAVTPCVAVQATVT